MPYGIEYVTVIGAGTMGAAIAGHLANAGIRCSLLDIAPAELTPEEQAAGLALTARKVRTERWTTKDGEARESTVLEASLIGHDLTWCVTKLRKVERQTAVAATSDGTVAALEELEGESAA